MVKSKVDDISVLGIHSFHTLRTHCGTFCLLLRIICSICVLDFALNDSFPYLQSYPSEVFNSKTYIHRHWTLESVKKSRYFIHEAFLRHLQRQRFETQTIDFIAFSRSIAPYGFIYFSSQNLDSDVITIERNADLMHTVSLCVFNNAMRARLLSPPPLMRCIYTIKWFEPFWTCNNIYL